MEKGRLERLPYPEEEEEEEVKLDAPKLGQADYLKVIMELFLCYLF